MDIQSLNGSVINSRANTRQQIVSSLIKYAETLPEYAQWRDHFASGVGYNLISQLAAMCELIIFKKDIAMLEAYIDTARTKPASFKLAAPFGYNPNRKKHANGTIRGVIADPSPYPFSIPRGFTIDGKVPLVVAENIQVPAGETVIEDIPVMQGIWKTQSYSAAEGTLDGVDWEILIVDEEDFMIDNFEFYIEVNDIPMLTRDDLLLQVSDLMDDNLRGYSVDESKPISQRLDDAVANTVVCRTDYMGGMQIMFADGVFGKALDLASEVKITYLQTLGMDGMLEKGTNLGTYLVSGVGETGHRVTFTVSQTVQGGTDEDSVEKINYLAPKYNTIQQRAVNKGDYEIMALSYPGVISAKANRLDDKCCTVCVSALRADLEKDVDIPWSEADIAEFITYTERFTMLSAKIDFWEPEPILLNAVFRVVIRPGVDTESLDVRIKEEIIKSYCYRLQSTFRSTKVLSDITKLDDTIVRVYIDNINGDILAKDIELPCNGFFKMGAIDINFETEYLNIKR